MPAFGPAMILPGACGIMLCLSVLHRFTIPDMPYRLSLNMQRGDHVPLRLSRAMF